jgi:hypothetical protein
MGGEYSWVDSWVGVANFDVVDISPVVESLGRIEVLLQKIVEMHEKEKAK